jgi:UDP-glucose 4-epimerase
MKTLILGNGLIAKAIASRLLLAKEEVVIISRNTEDQLQGVQYLQYSLEEMADNAALFTDADNVVHTISTTSPANSMLNIYRDAYENVLLNIKLIDMLARLEGKKFIFLSSGGAVYGNPNSSSVNEEHATDPISAYGVAKLSVEKYLHLYGYHYGFNYLILRPSNIYGYIKSIKKPQGVINHLLDCVYNNKPFNLWGSINNSKDYLYIDDFAAAVMLALHQQKMPAAKVYNISFGKTHSLAEIIDIIEKNTGKKITIETAGQTRFDVKNINVDSSLFKQTFNWQPNFEIADGISKIISQYQAALINK